MKNMTRRSLLTMGGSGLLMAAALNGCVTTKVDGVTTITLNVAKLNDYVQAGINAANTVVNLVQVVPAYASQVTVLKDILSKLQTAAVNLTAVAGGKVEINYADADKKVLVDSILSLILTVSDAVTVILNMVVPGSKVLSDAKLSQIRVIQDSITTIVSVFQAMLRSATDYSFNKPTSPNMFAEYKALKTLGV